MIRVFITAVVIWASIGAHAASTDAVVGATAPSAEKLPAKLTGRWIFINTSNRQFQGNWGVDQVTEDVEGNIRGKLTFTGVSCQTTDSPMIGKRNGTQIILTATVGRCGIGTFRLDKGTKHMLEGTHEMDSPGTPAPGGATVYLNP